MYRTWKVLAFITLTSHSTWIWYPLCGYRASLPHTNTEPWGCVLVFPALVSSLSGWNETGIFLRFPCLANNQHSRVGHKQALLASLPSLRFLQFSWLDICGPGINRSTDQLDAVTHDGYCVAFSLFILSSHGAYTLKMWLLEAIGAIWGGGGTVCRASRDLPVKQPETEGFCPLCSCFLFLVLFCVLTSFSLTILTFPNWQPVPTQGSQAALAPMWHAASSNWGFPISYDLTSIKQSRCHPFIAGI